MSGFTDFLQALDAALSRPAPAVVLLPFRLLVAPLVATHVGGWALGMLGTLALCGLHYAWVMRVDTAFEESAAQAGVELQAIISAAREGRGFAALRAQRRGRVRSPWFRLRPEGHPAVALFWKSFTAFSRNLSLGGTVTLVVILVGFRVLIGFTADSPHEAAMATAVVPAALAGMALFMGPLFLRNDLRTDFQRQELMRTFPLSGQSVVAAEVGASGASLAVVVAFFLTVSAAFFVVEGIAMPRPWIVPAAWLVSVVVATPLCVLAMGIQNLLVVAYPAWSSLGPTQQRGMDQTGTMILMMLVTGILLAIGVLIPVFAGGVIAMRLVSALGLWVAVPAAMGAWLTLVGECVLLVVLLGDAYDALDPSEAGLLG
jgi:hypothetical protein